MKRKGKSTQKGQRQIGQIPEENEVDSFHSNQEKVLLEEAGRYGGFGGDNGDAMEDEIDDEEVLGIDDDEGDEEQFDEEFDEEGEEEDEEEETVQGWGGRKNYYGGDEVDDNESSKQMTEEAKRQQKQQLEELGIADYFDDDMVDDWNAKSASFDQQTFKSLVINQDLDMTKLEKSEKLDLLKTSFPEFIPLLEELAKLYPKLQDFGTDEVSNIKRISLTAYLIAVSSYFLIFVDRIKANEPFSNMKEHSVMESILTARQIWKDVENIRVIGGNGTNGARESDDEEFVDAREIMDDQIEDFHQDIQYDEDLHDEYSQELQEEQVQTLEEDLNINISINRQIKQSNKSNKSDFTESTLDEIDQEEKVAKRKSLRFYTAKIDKSQAKNAERYSGDLDLPYKERLFERKQRLIEEARKRGLQGGDNLNDQEINEDDLELANEINNDDYYRTVQASKQHKVESRKSAHRQAVKLAREGKLLETQELVGQDGKRALNFQIMKNKGLTAKKRKEVRNARVKKRKKHEKAQKKLKSVRQVYEGSKGPYEGEKTGIKKGISRSVKLG